MSTEPPYDILQRCDQLCDQFEQAFRAGGHPDIAMFVPQIAAEYQRDLLRALVALEAELRASAGERPGCRSTWIGFQSTGRQSRRPLRRSIRA